MTYWNNDGKYPLLVKLCEDMLPAKGPTGYVEIEAFRAAVRIYYDLYNNGFGNNWTGAFNYLKSLHIVGLEQDLAVVEPYKFGEVYGKLTGPDDELAVAAENIMDKVLIYVMQAHLPKV